MRLPHVSIVGIFTTFLVSGCAPKNQSDAVMKPGGIPTITSVTAPVSQPTVQSNEPEGFYKFTEDSGVMHVRRDPSGKFFVFAIRTIERDTNKECNVEVWEDPESTRTDSGLPTAASGDDGRIFTIGFDSAGAELAISEQASLADFCGGTASFGGRYSRITTQEETSRANALLNEGVGAPLSIPSAGSAAPTTSVSTRELPISAIELSIEYQNNEAAADSKFKGRSLLVTGFVESITKDLTDTSVLTLKGVTILGVRAAMGSSEEAQVIALSKGAVVNLGCRGAGEVISVPQLDDCRFR